MDADLCVIGGGEAGFATAMAGAALGRKVVLVDPQRADPCWRNWDVVLAALRLEAAAGRTAGSEPSPDRIEVFRRRLRAALERGAADRRFARLAAMNIRLVQGHARFADPTTITAGDTTLRARRYILAIGAPADDGAGRLLAALIGSDRISIEPAFSGCDPRGVALSQGLRRLGFRVSLSGPLLPALDAELVAPLRRALVRDGVDVIERADTRSTVQPAGADDRWARLALDRANVARAGGDLVLSPALRTTNPRIYAVGASAGARSSAATQAQVGVVLRSALFRLPARHDPAGVPVCVCTEPAVASVGLSEATAQASDRLTVWRWPLGETSVGSADGPAAGILKVLADPRGRVVGAGIVHRDAAELIAFWSLAVGTRQSLASLAGIAMPAPAWAEGFRRVATQAALRRLQSPWLKRALRVLDRLP